MRVKNYLKSDYVSLSRAIAGVKSRTLIINLPGSKKAVQENLIIIYPLLKQKMMLVISWIKFSVQFIKKNPFLNSKLATTP